MKIIVLLASLYAFVNAQSCYTVQILSLPASKNNLNQVQSNSYPESCQSMKIGANVTVRCGCHEKYQNAVDTLSDFKKDYSQAYVATTYKKRFTTAQNKVYDTDEQDEIQTLKDIISELRVKIDNLVKKKNVLQQYSVNSSDRNGYYKEGLQSNKLITKEDYLESFRVMQIQATLMEKEYIQAEEEMNKQALLAEENRLIQSLAEDEAMKREALRVEQEYIVEQEYLAAADKVEMQKADLINTEAKKRAKKEAKKNKYKKKPENRSAYSKYLLPFTGYYKTSALSGRYGSRALDYKYRFGAQISYDLGYVDEFPNGYSGHQWRRVRIFHKGSFFDESLFYELEYSLTGASHVKDVFIGYKGKISSYDTNYRFKVGNIKIPFSLDTYSSSKYLSFMERGLTDAFADNRKIGYELLLSKKISKDRVNLFISQFENSIDDFKKDPIKGYSSRLVYTKKFAKTHLVSTGLGIKRIRHYGDNVRFNQGIESSLGKKNYVSVRVKNIDNVRTNNLELLYINKDYSLQGEYTTTRMKSSTNGYYDFKAYYLQGSYFIFGTGKRYRMSTSTLSKVLPGREGSLELAMRYSYIDLHDRDELGGTQSSFNYALNWYITKELKVMLNYVSTRPKNTEEYDGTINVYQARVLFAF